MKTSAEPNGQTNSAQPGSENTKPNKHKWCDRLQGQKEREDMPLDTDEDDFFTDATWKAWPCLTWITPCCLCLCRASRVGVWARESAQHDRLRRAHQMRRQRDSSADGDVEGERRPSAGSVPTRTHLNAVWPSDSCSAHLHVNHQFPFTEYLDELSVCWSQLV